jgi:hypothetical protein
MKRRSVALFTTLYPEGERFFDDFFRSLSCQTDRAFDLWIGLDRFPESKIEYYCSDDLSITSISRLNNETNVQLRQRALEEMIDEYRGIAFVDSDDILATSRVSEARAALDYCDVYGCSMRIVDVNGVDLSLSFNKPQNISIDSILPRFNIFGMSNTCYSSEILGKCMPFPVDCILLDWFVATRAWIHDAKMAFDPVQRMCYRQYAANTARVVPPFTEEQIVRSAELVKQHYSFILHDIPELAGSKKGIIQIASDNFEEFWSAITGSPPTLTEYVEQLNALPADHIWWSCIAHPDLESLWKS